MQENSIRNWLKWGLLCLSLVAMYGFLMRYKIVFDLPQLQQKNLLHAHSHLAFSGWVSHGLYGLLLLIMQPVLPRNANRFFGFLFIANFFCALAMLPAFTLQGYGFWSILFSTATIFIAIAFFIGISLNFKLLNAHFYVAKWIWAALFLHVISSAGPGYLAYAMISKNIDSELYLGSVYYYLHFQYSGWFFLAAMAIVLHFVKDLFQVPAYYLYIFFASSLITFFLSILWADLHPLLYILTLIATVAQTVLWFFMLWKYVPAFSKWKSHFSNGFYRLFMIAILALSLKFILQLISVIPDLSELVFGIRPIVIAYLHLVLLGVYTLVLLGIFFQLGILKVARLSAFLTIMFLIGVGLNELLLGAQGLFAFFYIPFPYVHHALLGAASILFLSASGLAAFAFFTKKS